MSLYYLHHDGLYGAYGDGPHRCVFKRPVARSEFESWIEENGLPSMSPSLEEECPFSTDEEVLEAVFLNHEPIAAKVIAALLEIPVEKIEAHMDAKKRPDGR